MRKLLTFAALCSASIFTTTFRSFAAEKPAAHPDKQQAHFSGQLEL